MYTKPKLTYQFVTTLLCMLCLPYSAAYGKATFIINYVDNAQEGFNDSTAVSPVGNNTGTTLGNQRRIAFEYAVDKLSVILHSDVDIEVDAHFDPLGGSEFSATLAQAGPTTIHFDFNNAPESGIYYVQALANKLSGSDLDNSNADIDAEFNSDVDGNTVLGTDTWYYGLDANPPGLDTDFISVVIHELVHGLGFLALGNVSTGAYFLGRDDIYSFHLEHDGASEPTYSDMTNSQRAAANKATGDLQWAGAQTEANASTLLTSGLNQNNPQMYAPDPNESGSSVSHYSDALSPDQLMEPFYSDAIHDLGIAGAALSDMGWGNFTDLGLVLTDSSDPIDTDDTLFLVATLSNSGTSSADASTFTYTIPSGLTFLSANPSQGSCSSTSSSINCDLGTIASGGIANISFSLSVSETGSVTHNATVHASIVDSSPTNNSDTEITTILPAGTVTNNFAPTADSGSDQTVATNASVGLDGSGSSDSDGSISSYSWLQISGAATATILNATSSKPTVVAPSAADTIVIQLTVTDDLGATASDTITITVSGTINSGGGDTSDNTSGTTSSGGGGGTLTYFGLFLLMTLSFRLFTKTK
ncbi:MAG: DUF11 domain-containing protein [Pseudomonadales bacterium]|nr:DUF11 domain-containing protein [Pseudomonadales bacterium]